MGFVSFSVLIQEPDSIPGNGPFDVRRRADL
jgi:hypothetical protein